MDWPFNFTKVERRKEKETTKTANYMVQEFHFTKSGQKESQGNFKDGKKDGMAIQFYESGKKAGGAVFKNGKLQRAKKWKPNGEVCPITNVKDGNGVSVIYNLDGTEKERFTFRDGVKIEP